jgi:hypothetical protein
MATLLPVAPASPPAYLTSFFTLALNRSSSSSHFGAGHFKHTAGDGNRWKKDCSVVGFRFKQAFPRVYA